MKIDLASLFEDARSHNSFLPREIPDSTLKSLYELMKWGPTSANCSPARILFVKSPQSKEVLLDCLASGNRDKTRSAAVTAIVGMDMAFYDKLPELFPHTDARAWFVDKPQFSEATAFRNSSLQGGYFIIAARALGLDCGPMSGFDAARVDAEFWCGSSIKTNFLCNLGYGDDAKLFSRSPRLKFDDACKLV